MNLFKNLAVFTAVLGLILFSFAISFAVPEGGLYQDDEQSHLVEEILEDEGEIQVQDELEAPVRTLNLRSVHDQVFSQAKEEETEKTEDN